MLELMGGIFCLLLIVMAAMLYVEVCNYFKNLNLFQKDCLNRIKVLEEKSK